MREGILFISGFFVTVLIIPWMRRFSLKVGYLDRPGRDPLKVHSVPIPNSGGLAIFGVFALLMIFLSLDDLFGGHQVVGLVVGGGFALALGVWDDLKHAHPGIRFIGEVFAGLILIFFGTRIGTSLFLSIPLTLFYVVGAINAVNLEDGLDGLAGGLTLLSFLGFALLSAKMGENAGIAISILLGGILLGFLIYNFNPASIFMGDGGSYFLGFVLGYLAVSFTHFHHWSSFLSPILIVGIPVLDTAFAILRRLRKGVSPFSGDRSHFYDLLVEKGFSVRRTVLICWLIQTFLVIIGLALYPVP